MTIALLSPVPHFDFASYAKSLEKYRIEAEEAAGSATGEKDNLSRTIIEDECAAYILDKAETLNLTVNSAEVSAAWSSEGYWYPYKAKLNITGTDAGREKLTDAIESELGIPRDRQNWGEGG
jgi:hypothetical protein